MNLTSVRLYLFLLILFALLGISSVYATTYHVEANGWWVDYFTGNNNTFSKSADVSVVNPVAWLQPFGAPLFLAKYQKFGDIEGVHVEGWAYSCEIFKPIVKVSGTQNEIQKSFTLDFNLTNLGASNNNCYRGIHTTFVFPPENVSGSGDSYEWHVKGVIEYSHEHKDPYYYKEHNKTFNDSGIISVGGVIVKRYFVENPNVELGKLGNGGFIMVMKCYKEGNNTKINVTVVPTYEYVGEWDYFLHHYYNNGYWGSVTVTINNEPRSFNFGKGSAYRIWYLGDYSYIKTHTWDVTNAPTVGDNQPVKSSIPPIAIIIALITISIIALRKLAN